MSFKYKLFKELFKMSSAAAQKASTKSFQFFSTFAVVDPTQPTKTEKISTQPMDSSGLSRPSWLVMVYLTGDGHPSQY